MSTIYKIGCRKCSVNLWIGQGGHIYTAKKYIKALTKFLFEHLGHSLEFNNDEYWFELEMSNPHWKEIE